MHLICCELPSSDNEHAYTGLEGATCSSVEVPLELKKHSWMLHPRGGIMGDRKGGGEGNASDSTIPCTAMQVASMAA